MARFIPFVLHALVFGLPAFFLAGWILFLTSQPIWVKLIACPLLIAVGIWNTARAWDALVRRREPPRPQ